MSDNAMQRATGRAQAAMLGHAAQQATGTMGRATEQAAGTMGQAAQQAAGTMGRATERATAMMGRATERSATTVMDTAMASGMAWWDLMLRMQRASLATLSVYSPARDLRIAASLPEGSAERGQAATAVLPVGEERLNVGTRTILGETTRIRRRVVAQPVEQEVTLREERVVVERRPAAASTVTAEAAPRAGVLTETVVEMSDSRQVPQVWKSVHVAEEVVLRREVTERKGRVRETLRRDVVEVEHEDEGRIEAAAAAARLPRAEERERAEAEAEAARRRIEAEVEAARQRSAIEAEAARLRAEAAAEATPTPPAAATGPAAAGDEQRRRAEAPGAAGPRKGGNGG